MIVGTEKGSETHPDSEEQAIKKISEFISRFHSIFLPLTSNKGVYRDLTDHEESLLNSLSDSPLLHSILAGCLAVDSFISNILETEKNLTYSLLKDMTLLLNNYVSLECAFQDLQARHQLDGLPFLACSKRMGRDLKVLAHHLHHLHFAESSEQVKKHRQLCQSMIPTKSSEISRTEKQSLMEEIIDQNSALKQQIETAQKKINRLQTQLMKATGKSKILGSRSSFGDLAQLQSQLSEQTNLVSDLQLQHSRQKNHLNREIMRLENQLQAVYKYTDANTMELFQELEDQIFQLKQEKKQDERIIENIQNKMEFLNVKRKSRNVTGESGVRASKNRVAGYCIQSSRQSQEPEGFGLSDRASRNNDYTFSEESEQEKTFAIKKTQTCQPISEKLQKRVFRDNGQLNIHMRYYNQRHAVPRYETETYPRILQRYRSGDLDTRVINDTFGQAITHENLNTFKQQQNGDKRRSGRSDRKYALKQQLLISSPGYRGNEGPINSPEINYQRRVRTKYQA